jgi:hypothetical protein
MGQWRYSLFTESLTATVQVAKRVHSLAQQEQNDSALTNDGSLPGFYQTRSSFGATSRPRENMRCVRLTYICLYAIIPSRNFHEPTVKAESAQPHRL